MRQLDKTAALWTTTTAAAAALGIAALASPGCQRYRNVPRGAVKDEPVVIDEAMQIRDWEPSSARYTNPRFIAGPTGFLYQPAYDMPAPVYAAQETPMFILQALALPVTVWLPPLYTPVEYAGETLEPTWHAMPPLPKARPGEPPAPPEVTDRGMDDEPMPVPAEPGTDLPAPYDEAPGRTVIPGTEPTRGLELESERVAPATRPGAVPPGAPVAPRTETTPTPAPAAPRTVTTPAPAARPSAVPATRPATPPATQPTATYTPSAVTPARSSPATRPTTVPARDVNK
jgi:hypothetical protein